MKDQCMVKRSVPSPGRYSQIFNEQMKYRFPDADPQLTRKLPQIQAVKHRSHSSSHICPSSFTKISHFESSVRGSPSLGLRINNIDAHGITVSWSPGRDTKASAFWSKTIGGQLYYQRSGRKDYHYLTEFRGFVRQHVISG
jgi:hypothetical protein